MPGAPARRPGLGLRLHQVPWRMLGAGLALLGWAVGRAVCRAPSAYPFPVTTTRVLC